MGPFYGTSQGYLNYDQTRHERGNDAVKNLYTQAMTQQLMQAMQLKMRQQQQQEGALGMAGGAFADVMGRMPQMLPPPPGSGMGPQPPAPGQASEPAAPPPTPIPPYQTIQPPPGAAPAGGGAQGIQARMRVPPEVQAGRDAQAGDIRRREQMPDGGGMLPSSSVLGPPPGAEPGPQAGNMLPPPPTEGGAAPGAPSQAQPLTPSLQQIVSALVARGASGAELMRALEAIRPTLDAMSQAQVKMLNNEVAMLRARTQQSEHDRRVTQGDRRGDQRDTDAEERTRANQERERIQRERIAAGGGAGGGSVAYTPETIDRLAQRVIAGDGGVYREIGFTKGALEARRRVQERATELMKERGMDPIEQVVNKLDLAGAQRAMSNRQNFVSAVNQFINNFDSQIDLVKKLAPKGTAGGVPLINKWIQSGRVAIAGDPDVSAFDTALRGLAREHQRIVTGVTSNAQLHVSAQQTADELLNRAQTEEQLYSVLGVMKEEAENARKAGVDEVNAIRGRVREMGRSQTPGTPQASPGASTRKQVGGKWYSKRGADWYPEE